MRSAKSVTWFGDEGPERAQGWRYRYTTEQGGIWIGYDDDPEWTPIGRWFVPQHFQALVRFGPPYDLHLSYRTNEAAPALEKLCIQSQVTTESDWEASDIWGERDQDAFHVENVQITTRGLRRVRVEDAYRAGVLAAAHHSKHGDPAPMTLEEWDDLWQERPDDLAGAKRPVLNDDHYRDVADIYRQAVSQRRPPTKAVASHWVRHSSTAARWVMEARKRGHLGPTRQGKAGEDES